MNSKVLFREAPVSMQDKIGGTRLSAPSDQPSTAEITALHTPMVPENRDHEESLPKRRHSTKRQTVFAGSWIDRNTDFYHSRPPTPNPRLRRKKFTRSKIIAMMLRERAQDDTFQHSQ